MIEQGLFKRHFVGRDGFHWWIGQVADAKTWRENNPSKRVSNNTESKGFGQRYKVRIMGYHTAVPTDLPDEDLPWASVMYPVTAGSGNNGSSQSVNILQGDFVYGFFLDGEDGQQPVIMGVAGYNDYQAVMKNVPDAKFVPFSGLDASVANNNKLPVGSRKEGGAGEYVRQNGSQGEQDVNKDQINSATLGLGDQDKANINDDDSTERALQPLAQSKVCEPLPLSKIQKQLQNSLQEIEKIRKSIYESQSSAKEKFDEEQKKIDDKIEKAAELVASAIKWVYQEIEQFIEFQINKAFKNVYNIALPNERELVNTTSNTVLDTIKCFFKKLFKQLKEMVIKFIKDTVNKVINVPICFVENFVGGVLGSLSTTISGVFNGINDLVESAIDIVDSGFDIATDVINLVDNILSFLTCDDRPECSGVNEWNPRSGAAPIQLGDFTKIAEKAMSFAEEPTTFGTAALDQFGNLIDIDLSRVFDFEDCNTDPELLGPPELQIFGDDGFGAAGNLVIGELGEVIGVDVTSFGQGYTGKAKARVYDKSGRGKGARIKPIFGPVPRSGISKIENGPEENTVTGKTVEVTIKTSKRRVKVGKKVTISWSVRNADKIKTSSNLNDIDTKKFSGKVKVVIKKGFQTFRITGSGSGDRVTAKVKVEGTLGDTYRVPNFSNTPGPNGPGNYRPSNKGSNENPDFPSTPGLLFPARSGGGGGAGPLGFGPFPANEAAEEYPFPANPYDNVYAPEPFNPTRGVYDTPIYGLGPSFYRIQPIVDRAPGRVNSKKSNLLEFENSLVPVEFTITRRSKNNNRITFVMRDVEKFAGVGELNFTFTGNDIGKEVRLISPNTDYFVRSYHPDGTQYPFPVANSPDATTEPFKIENNKKTLALDEVSGRREVEVIDVYERVVNDAATEADIIWTFGNESEQIAYEADRVGYAKKNLRVKDDNKKIEIDDGPGNSFDVNATFKITEGNARFSDDGLKVIGSGKVGIELVWDDNPNVSGVAIKSIAISGAGVKDNGSDVVWAQTDTGKPDGNPVERGEDFESFIMQTGPRIIREEVKRTEKVGGKSDGDYDDLVITVDKGKFRLRKKVAGLAIYRYEPDQSSGPGGPSPTIPQLPEDPVTPPDVSIPQPPDLPGGNDIGIVDFVIDDPGTGYKGNFDGSRGGDGRVWSQPNDTIVKRDDGVWEIPIPPGNPFCFNVGDIVTIPVGTVVVTEPRDGVGGGETIIGGSPYLMTRPGCITTPEIGSGIDGVGPDGTGIGVGPDRTGIGGGQVSLPREPTLGTGEYPVIMYLCEIIIKNRGFGYVKGDKVIIEPSMGASAEAVLDNFGRVIEVKITKPGEGFKQMPNIYIESKTGYNAQFIAKLCIDRDGAKDPEDTDKVITVIDCVGLDANGAIDGKLYYGPYHEHEGRRMLGAKHSPKPHRFLDNVGGAGNQSD